MNNEDFEKWQAEMPTPDLLEKAREYIRENSRHYGKRWKMSIPPQRGDADMIFGEVCRRLENAQELINALGFYADKYNYREDYLPASDRLSASNVAIDSGEVARAAIAKAKNETP